MGRPRTAQHKRRQPISVSLPKDLIALWDKSLTRKQTRSRWIENILRRELQPIEVYGSIEGDLMDYHCKKCDNKFQVLPIRNRIRGVHHPIERVCPKCNEYALRHDHAGEF